MLFSDLKGNICQFDISQKDYTGYDPIPLKGTETPVLVEYEAGDTDVLKPVRGCSATLNYINEGDNGSTLSKIIDVNAGDTYIVNWDGIPAAGDIIEISVINSNSDTGTWQVTVLSGWTIYDFVEAFLELINVPGADYIATHQVNSFIYQGIAIQNIANSAITSSATTMTLMSATTIAVPLSDFFSEDDGEFLGEYYINSVLKFKGLLVQDDCKESFNAVPYPVELKFNDGLGLLSEYTLSDTILNQGVATKESVASFLYALLQLTAIDMPMEIYNNVFENAMDDRNADPTNDPFVQSFLKTASFKNENAYEDCFSVLEKLLKAADCVLFQSDGAWCIMRWPELPRFNNNPPGSVLALNLLTETVIWSASFSGLGGSFQFSGNSQAGRFSVGASFSITDASDSRLNGTYTVSYIITDGGAGSDLVVTVYEQPTEPLLTESVTVTIQSSQSSFDATVADDLRVLTIAAGDDLVPIEFTQLKSLRRGFRYVQRTFDYKIPDLIANQNLSELGAFIGTSIDGDFTNDDYGLIGWNPQQGQTAYIRVVTETLTGDEKNRYIVMDYDGIQSVNQMPSAAIITPKIEVGINDKWKFSCRYRASADFNNTEFFGVGFYLRPCAGGSFKTLTATNNVDASTNVAFWSTYIPFSAFDPGVPIPGRSLRRFASQDKAEWADYSASNCFDPNNFGLPAFPFDGTLEIGIYGKNDWAGNQTDSADTYVKDIKLEYFYFITDSTQIAGQIHTASGAPAIKNVLSEQIYMDDAPRQNIGGSIYLDDNETCSTLSSQWKTSSDNTNLYRFGQIQTIDRLGMNQKTRLRIEGDFYMNEIPSMKDIFSFGYGGLSAYTFIMSRAAFDYKNQKLTATFDEAWNTADEDATDLAAFNYDFKFKFKDADQG